MSTSHVGDYCIHKDKMCMTRQDAAIAVRSLARKNPAEAYKCHHCGRWHIAHKRRPSQKFSSMYGSALKAAHR